MRAGTSLIAFVLTLAAPAPAQQSAPDPYAMAIAAGYKAAVTCSAVFIGGRDPRDLARHELRGIYPEYDRLVPTLDGEIDRAHGLVRVGYSSTMPPRIAEFHRATGCTNLPIGAGPTGTAETPPPVIAGSPRPWPIGDALPRIAYPALPPVAAAFDGTTYGKGTDTTAVVVVSDGKLIAERYAPGFGAYVAQRTWSAAKSITGTLVAIAGLDPSRHATIAAWQTAGDPRRAITLDNLMRMASGLHSDTAGNRTDAVYFGGTAVSDNVVQWPLEARPGTRYRYANNDILLAMLSIRQTIGEARYRQFPRTALFAPLGMTHTVAETDWRGNYVSSSQVWSTARDLARFGILYADGGTWNGRRILPAAWIRYVATPSGPQPTGELGYGATFWLINKSPGVPADTFAAQGNRGQYVVIVPSRKMVIVRRGEDPAGAPAFDIARFTRDILASAR